MTNALNAEKHRILVIDDNADATLTLSMLLRMKGYEVLARNSALAGIEAAEAFRPTVVLCDLGMPEMDGYETSQRIRQQPWGKQVLLVALTGYGRQEDKKRSLEAGFDDFLIKPIDLDQLAQLLVSRPPQAEQGGRGLSAG